MNVIAMTTAGSLFEDQLRLRLSEELLRLVRAQQDHDDMQVQISRSVIEDLRRLADRNDRTLVEDELAVELAAG